MLHVSAFCGHPQVYQIAKYFEEGIIITVIFSGAIRSYYLLGNWIYEEKRFMSYVGIVKYIRWLYCNIYVANTAVEVRI